jgi:ubiquitin carboxyl-terminal hydrolase MINDY-1/2
MKKFLNSSQLTIFGLMKLHELKNGSLSILFRNNHFSTLFKYQDQLYCLVTDEGYQNKPDIVWEKIQDEEGDTLLCKGDFSIYSPKKIPQQRKEENTDDLCSIS